MITNFFTVSNYNNGLCLAFPFTYDSAISRFMMAYCLFKTSYDKNPNVIKWFTDVYDEMLDEKFVNGWFTKSSEENLFEVPFGYDGVKMQANITNRVWNVTEESYHFGNQNKLEIPFCKIGDKCIFSTTEMFDLKKLNETILVNLYNLFFKKDTSKLDIVQIGKKYDEIRSQLNDFENGLKFKVFDIDVEYGYITSYNQLLSLMPKFGK